MKIKITLELELDDEVFGLGEEAFPECSIELLMLKYKTNVK
jgi:hypothetical protein